MNFKATDLSSSLGKTKGAARLAAPGDGEDFLTRGPNLPLQPGHYRAVYHYQYLSPPDPAHPATYDLLVHHPAADIATRELPLPYQNNQPQVFVDEFTVTKPGLNYDMRITYHNSGTLRVDALDLTSLEP
jgi:hypothetical protein